MDTNYNKKRVWHQLKTKSKTTFLGYLLLGLLSGAFLHVSHSCIDTFSFDREKEEIDLSGIKKGASDIESAFSNADTTVLASLLTETSLEIYRETFPEILVYMPHYAKAFESRKLLFANQIFAVYEFEAEGITYTVEMTVGDDGDWKLVRF
ncbi:MAG: hypothetical protein JXR22_09555 [Prolixibacteraceae bacterium]|nr:hypothetical protein [Prolixibacteraceae bacterium]